MTESSVEGHIESAQRLKEISGRRWSQKALLDSAEKAELRNTGWPIGLVIHQAELAPVPMADGIEARLEHRGTGKIEDFWSFRNDGSYYVSRLLEEDSGQPSFTTSGGHPERAIWFDVRIWRIAEVLLHSATLYRELGIPPNEPYLLSVNHQGLDGREFYVSTFKRMVFRGKICQSTEASWTQEVTQDYVTSNLKSLVGEIASGLFVLFDFTEVSQKVIDEIVDEFLHSRL